MLGAGEGDGMRPAPPHDEPFRFPVRWHDPARVPATLTDVPDVVYDVPGGALVWERRGDAVLDAERRQIEGVQRACTFSEGPRQRRDGECD